MNNVSYGKRTVIVSKNFRLSSSNAASKPYTKVLPTKTPSKTASRHRFNIDASTVKKFFLTKNDERSYFSPKTWFFWRGIIMYFFIFSVVGHWLEIPYCLSMHALFGIVENDYAVWTDPLYAPYWVYGVGTVIITLIMLPLKMNMLKRRKTMWGACLEFFVIAVVLCAAMETIIGFMINQPDAAGEYPFWNNSILPFNILGQGWLVNDIILGLVAVLYTWVAFPFCQKLMGFASHKVANGIFVGVLIGAVITCVLTYAF